MKSVQELIDDISGDRTSGASQLAVRALETIRSAISLNQAADADEFKTEIALLVKRLSECRPAMVSIKNSMQQFMRKLETYAETNMTLDYRRREYIDIVDRLLIDLEANKKSSILNTVGLIRTAPNVATCSYSSTIVEALLQVEQVGAKPKVLIIKSQLGSISHGQKTMQYLQNHGLQCRLVEDDFKVDSLDGVEQVVLGSDKVFPDGSVMNGYPSLRLAQMAAEHNPPIPVYAVGDTSKLCDEMEAGKETGFEIIPVELLTGIITEDGLFDQDNIIPYLESRMNS